MLDIGLCTLKIGKSGRLSLFVGLSARSVQTQESDNLLDLDNFVRVLEPADSLRRDRLESSLNETEIAVRLENLAVLVCELVQLCAIERVVGPAKVRVGRLVELLEGQEKVA